VVLLAFIRRGGLDDAGGGEEKARGCLPYNDNIRWHCASASRMAEGRGVDKKNKQTKIYVGRSKKLKIMADALEADTRLLSLIEKVTNIPAKDPSNSCIYLVKSSTVETVVLASSSFEAAVKLAYMLSELKSLPSTCTVEKHEGANTKSAFNCYLRNNKFIEVELETLEDRETSEEIIEDDETDVQLAEIDTDVNISEDIIDDALKKFFKFTCFRSLQKETILATMSQKDVLTVVGTGGGKTLMYLLPAVLSEKATLVVCPLKSLIDDLVIRCNTLNIDCCKFTGDVLEDDLKLQLDAINNYRVMFATPEMLEYGSHLRVKIEQLIENDGIERIVFDEAHTISTWGNTFRPVYKTVTEQLAKAKCPKLLLSATIPLKLENDLRETFGNFITYRTSIYRDNLLLQVVERSSKMFDDLADFIESHREESGIVYCVIPNDVAKVHAELVKRGISAVKYHGQLSEHVKSTSLSKWMRGDVKVMVANSSFGMGIDKSNVRYILHARLPTCIEEYLQQCGRAGRDGLPAICRLYFSSSDKNPLYKLFFTQGKNNFSAESTYLNDLILMLQDPVQCRHKALMAYFGEKVDNFICIENCDNCLNRGTYQTTDGTSDSLNVVQALVELTGREVNANTLKLFLMGSNQKAVAGLDNLATFGSLKKKFTATMLAKFLHLLIVDEVLAENVQRKGSSSLSITVSLGPKAHNIIAMDMSVSKYETVKK